MVSLLRKLFPANIQDTAIRFLGPVLCISLATFVTVLMIHDVEIMKKDEDFIRLLMTLFAAAVAGLSFRLFHETHVDYFPELDIPFLPEAVTAGAAVLIGLLMYLTQSFYIPYLFLFPALLISLMFAPYLLTPSEDADCCHFNSALAFNILFAGISTLILCGGLSTIMFSIHFLFDVKIEGEVYADIWCIGAMFFGPFYALSNMPKYYNFSVQEQYTYPLAVKFIATYLLAPLLTIYTVILYAYMVKILIQWDLPKGHLAYMITGYGIVGVLTHFLAYPLRDEAKGVLKFINDYFYHALLIPIVLMAMAIWVRVDAYGITENRYAVILATIWFGGTALYMVLSQAKSLKVIPVGISILGLLACFGPWGAMSTSARSQVSRLETLLTANNILVDGKIVKKDDHMISLEDQKNVTSIVRYLAHSGKAKRIVHWFPKGSYLHKEEVKEGRRSYRYGAASEIMKDMGLKEVYKWQNEESYYLAFSSTYYKTGHLFDLRDYDYMVQNIHLYDAGKPKTFIQNADGETIVDHNTVEKQKALDLLQDKTWFRVVMEGDELIVTDRHQRAVRFSFADVLVSRDMRDNDQAEPLKLTQSKDGFTVVIDMHSMNIEKKEGETKISNLSFSLFIASTAPTTDVRDTIEP